MQDLRDKDIILREPPLAAGQHTANKCLALVCSHCFQFLGSITMQLAWCRLAASANGVYFDLSPACRAWPSGAWPNAAWSNAAWKQCCMVKRCMVTCCMAKQCDHLAGWAFAQLECNDDSATCDKYMMIAHVVLPQICCLIQLVQVTKLYCRL